MFSKLAFLSLATLAPLVAAHGSIHAAWIDGTRYAAPYPNRDDSSKFAIRGINDINPVKGTSNPDMNCGHGAQKAGLVADAAPGSVVKFAWQNGEGGTWVHNTGPVMTYMASCGNNGCASFDAAEAKFFKISELGKHEDGTWFMRDLTTGPEATTSVTLPTNLPAGEYLIRHELIAMQLGMTQGGAEFYPACMQIRLSAPTRTGAALPSGNSLVSFPGGYSDNDPGIFFPDVYNPGTNYIFPGPAVISDTGSSPSASSSANPSASTDLPGTPSSSSQSNAPAPTGGSGCGGSLRKKKRVVKRIVQQGPLIKRSSKGSAAAAPINKRQGNSASPNHDWKRSSHERPFVRSRMMRAV